MTTEKVDTDTHLPSCFAWTASWPHEVPTRARRAADPADVTCPACIHALGSQQHTPPRYSPAKQHGRDLLDGKVGEV